VGPAAPDAHDRLRRQGLDAHRLTGPAATAGLRRGAIAGVPFALAVGAFGVAFGVLARSVGMGWAAPIVMSVTTFAGSSQFAAASVLDAGGAASAAVVAALLLNARYIPIGISAASSFEGRPFRRFLQAQLVVDESWALSRRPDGSHDRTILLGSGVVLGLAWVGGTIIGSLGSGVLGDPNRLGLDAAFPALFLALLWIHIRGRRELAAAAAGAAIALALVPFTPPGVPIIAASAACLIGLVR